MIRILLLLVPVILIYLFVRWLQAVPKNEKRLLVKKAVWIIAIIALLMLAATGRLNLVFAVLGVFIAFLWRLLPYILRYAPEWHRLWLLYVNAKSGKGGGNEQQAHRKRGLTMSKAEALQVLGLKPGASADDVVQAHRRLISKLHPDKGGSDYLAAQINQAKNILLNG